MRATLPPNISSPLPVFRLLFYGQKVLALLDSQSPRCGRVREHLQWYDTFAGLPHQTALSPEMRSNVHYVTPDPISEI